ncbi:related to kinesin light chain [Serendipita indica DSM 11827]|uniref:Related to kinesin light chain n=1 Tax=Serendipita indica (strain DSM 11827) TaxID=1109443 RepID=G4TY87_SERID|nr:related to kinesin light chain [Serendipita indica DSM 11827]
MDRSTPVLVSKSGKSSDSKPGSKLDDLGFLELVPGNDPIVDIVAIHGLQGHREKSWMTDDGVCWLRHLLPSDLPNVRILSYGYDADTRSRECVSTQTLGRHADGFAYALSRERKDAPRRPIIFVAHDVGGIVLKSALVICHNQNLDSDCQLRNILVSTHGILFFGTPHFGLEGTTYHEVLNRLASVYMETTNIILKDLEDHSSELEHIQRLYASASEKISSIFFCEEYATSGISNLSEVNVPHHKAIIAGDRNATTIVLHANHRNLVRFTSKGNDNYRTVRYHLEAYVDHGPEAVCKEWVREDDCRNAAKGKSAPEPGVMPKPRPVPSRTYIERKNIEYLITQKLLQTGQGKRQPRCILYGLGGSGKTQLATKWIQDHEHNFSRVIFVDASSQQHLEADLERSIRSLGPEYAKMTWNDAVAYLDGKEKGWLLFFDNADSEKLELRPYLPGSVHGTILITTRNAHCNKYARDGAVHVGDLEDNEAVNLLHTIANVAPASDVESLKIVRELGMLALAITQAGAYIGNTRRLDTYLDTFHEHRDQLLRSKPEIDAEYAFSTYAAFDLFFKNLPENTQELLKLCASLHYSLIPIDLFRRSIQSEFSAYSMYLKDRLGGEEGRCYARMTAQLLLGAIRPIKDSNAWSWQLLPHVDRIPRSVQLESVAHALAFHELYNSVGNWKACQELLEPALTQLGQNEGQRNEDSLFVISRLADALQRDGQLSRAEKMQRDVLALRLEIHGEWHLDTISAMSNLADTLSRSGQLDEAETMARKVLTLRLEILGQRHPDTISATRNVAATLYRRGQLEEAEKMQREVLTQRVEILGKRHPDTISAMNSLAATLHKGGQLDEAEKLIREVLALRLEILGQRHPDTIVAVNNLATTLWKCDGDTWTTAS